MTTYFNLFRKQFHREFLLQLRQPRVLLHTWLFFTIVTVFFPLTLSPQNSIMRLIAPGIVWLATMLALLLSCNNLFQQDFETGVIEQWLCRGLPLSVIISAKLMIHWLMNLIPILLFCPLLGLFFHLTYFESGLIFLSLLLGTPAILFLCAFTAAFSSNKGMLMALVFFPLTIPILVFGSGTIHDAMLNLPILGYLALLLAISLFCIVFLPFAISAIIRISLTE